MSLLALGINHKTASVSLREQVAFGPEVINSALTSLLEVEGVHEAVILSTCNRTELYCTLGQSAKAEIIAWLERFHQLPPDSLTDALYCHQGEDAVAHLMQVACGLDSLVLGEPQILGQLKQSYAKAQELGTLGGIGERLFQKTFSVAKRVRTQTEIGSSAVSVAFAAVTLAKQIFGELAQRRVLLIGAGETIELVAKHLHQQQVANILVINRTLANAEHIARQFSGSAFTFESLGEQLPYADIIISSTASPVPVVGKGTVEHALKIRKYQPMLFIDIAVPRDIEPQVNDLEDAYLYTVDDLHDIIAQNVATRQKAAEQAHAIIAQETQAFIAWHRSLSSVQLIRHYRHQAQRVAQQELDRALHALSQGTSAEQALQDAVHRLTHKLIHAPTQALRHAGQQGDAQQLAVLSDVLGLSQD